MVEYLLRFDQIRYGILTSQMIKRSTGNVLEVSSAVVEPFPVRTTIDSLLMPNRFKKKVSEFQLGTNNGHTCIEYLKGLAHNVIY